MSKETILGITTALAGAGVILLAMMPLALPFIVLTIAATLPLLVAGLAIAPIVGVIVAPVLLLRRLRRRAGTPTNDRPPGARHNARAHASRAPRSSPGRARRQGCSSTPGPRAPARIPDESRR